MKPVEYGQHVTNIVLLIIGIVSINYLTDFSLEYEVLCFTGLLVFIFTIFYVLILNQDIRDESILNNNNNKVRHISINSVEKNVNPKREDLKILLFSAITSMMTFAGIMALFSLFIWLSLKVYTGSWEIFYYIMEILPTQKLKTDFLNLTIWDLYVYNHLEFIWIKLRIWIYIVLFGVCFMIMGKNSYVEQLRFRSAGMINVDIDPKDLIRISDEYSYSVVIFIDNDGSEPISVKDFKIKIPNNVTLKYGSREFKESFCLNDYFELKNIKEYVIGAKKSRILEFNLKHEYKDPKDCSNVLRLSADIKFEDVTHKKDLKIIVE
ncbi:hypothetical protein [Methanococcus maripaludis]|uniref:Uncharacterized protein n=1 Tax=Methanococcus maripaludis TaxID=39152 RepID=A0A2L1C940_METMI|nr:hypothetical protein [Methanococcus maripaludis]AVB75901.1 hypothetical protein MMJJ_04840 [Methanococcus maripaludis]